MELKGSKTHQNLKDAFAGESQANRRYLYFASKADVEGYNDVSAVFRSTAEGETGHAHGHLEYLEAVGDPVTGVPIGTTDKNLKSAIAGETYEYTDMYPGMAKTAREEGFEEIARLARDACQGGALAREPLQEGARYSRRISGNHEAVSAALAVSSRTAFAPFPVEEQDTMAEGNVAREGNLKAPYRHPLDWKNAEFWDEKALYREMERQFDICHTCRRCFPLCESFPTLFDLIDNSESLELDCVPHEAYWKVVDQCYLCDLCFMTKCPYTPPHEFNMDFPHLMLRAKAVRNKDEGSKLRDRVLTSTDAVGRLAGIPVVAQTVNAANRMPPLRYAPRENPRHPPQGEAARRSRRAAPVGVWRNTGRWKGSACRRQDAGRVAIFPPATATATCRVLVEDLVAVFEHNGIPVRLVPEERCCGMPKLEIGDLEAIEKLKNYNIPAPCESR